MELTKEQKIRFKQFFEAYTSLFAVLKADQNEGAASDEAYMLARTAIKMSDEELQQFKIRYTLWFANGEGPFNP
jgi:hypothetical protein